MPSVMAHEHPSQHDMLHPSILTIAECSSGPVNALQATILLLDVSSTSDLYISFSFGCVYSVVPLRSRADAASISPNKRLVSSPNTFKFPAICILWSCRVSSLAGSQTQFVDQDSLAAKHLDSSLSCLLAIFAQASILERFRTSLMLCNKQRMQSLASCF